MKLRRSTWLPIALFAYLAFMSWIGYPGYKSGENSPLYYFGIIGLTLLCIGLLRIFLLKRERLQRERESDLKEK